MMSHSWPCPPRLVTAHETTGSFHFAAKREQSISQQVESNHLIQRSYQQVNMAKQVRASVICGNNTSTLHVLRKKDETEEEKDEICFWSTTSEL